MLECKTKATCENLQNVSSVMLFKSPFVLTLIFKVLVIHTTYLQGGAEVLMIGNWVAWYDKSEKEGISSIRYPERMPHGGRGVQDVQ